MTKKRIFIFSAVTLVILTAWWTWSVFGPKPLGDKLEYVGKFDGGCWWICDGLPYTSYFYATDMAPQEIADYFKHAARADNQRLVPRTEQEADSYDITFTLALDDNKAKEFYIEYYSRGQERMRDFKFQVLNKKHVIEINSKDYNLIKDSL